MGCGCAVFDRVVHAEGVSDRCACCPEVRAQAETPTNRRTACACARACWTISSLSVDRLDYSKGLRQRFCSFERFLQGFPRLAQQCDVHADRAAIAR